jgi:predicted MFS family arabinose efflux permease
MHQSLGATELQANLITFITQLGYALGLVFVVPLADKVSRRKIMSLNMSIAVACCITIALAHSIWIVWAASIILGCNSVVPQMFIPVANNFSKPENKSRNMGIVLTGLLSGVLGARVLSGYVGEWAGWRAMFGIAAVIMAISLVIILRTLPVMASSFTGSYGKLMKSVVRIYLNYPPIRIYALRGGLSFGSMMAIWSCMAFHLSGSPFHAGSDAVGLLGLCGLAGATAASGIGKFIPRFGIERFCYAGTILQLIAWGFAIFLSDTYVGLINAIILVDVGAQCQQLSNQSGCLAMVPEATNRCNTVFMSYLFAGGSLGTLSAGLAWNNMGWTGVCLVGIAFASLSLVVSLLFTHRKHPMNCIF